MLWAGRLEEWAARNLLTLANNPGEITKKGAEHERDLAIDLVWYNEAAIQAVTFTGLAIDWEGSLGSDHAMLHVTGQTQEESQSHNLETNLGFIVDPERSEDWTRAFKVKSSAYHFQANPTKEEIEKEAETYMMNIHRTNEEVFKRHRPPHPKASPWWNAACSIATQNL